jgi:sec-independent protein translocase protein TatA
MFEGLFQPMHLLVILIIALLVFGPGKIPEIGSSLGKAIKGFKSALDEPGEKSGDTSDHKRIENKKNS